MHDGAGDDIGFDIDAVADLSRAEVGLLERGGDEGDGEGVGGDTGDGQGDAVDRDGALGDEEVQEVAGGVEGDAPVEGVGLDGGDRGDSVDVALNDVAAHERVGAGAVFEIHPVTGLEVTEVGHVERLADDIEPESGLVRIGRVGDGEAHAVDGDGFAVGRAMGPVEGIDGEGGAGVAGSDGGDVGEGLDEAGEHG